MTKSLLDSVISHDESTASSITTTATPTDRALKPASDALKNMRTQALTWCNASNLLTEHDVLQ